MATLKRWFEIIIYVVIAVAILLLFVGLIQRFDRLSFWERGVYLFLASTVLGYLLVQLGGFRLSHFLHISLFIKYPPLWFGTLIISVAALSLLEVRRAEDFIRLFRGTRCELVAIIFGLSVGVYWSWCKRSNKKIKRQKFRNPAAGDIIELLKDKGTFIKWLDEEAPIESQNRDLFHYELQAEKLATVLKEQPTKSIGLVGQYGCGKSSLLNLTKAHLYEDKKNIISTIGAWGFREGKAVELVLEHITEDIADHIDVLSITALPRQYQAMLSGCNNGIAKIISGIFTPRKPIEILEKIDGLLKKTGFRVVVFLEDLDRNLQQEILFEETAALLDSIHRLERITFVLAIGNHSEAQKLLTRLCEHIEIITPLNKQEVVRVIDVFRTWCMEEYHAEDIVPIDKRDVKFGAHRGDEYKWLLATREDLHPIDHAALLLRTPRALKSALRRSRITWRRLCGEIDFDDMYLMTILREAAPEAYLFINDNIDNLRYMSEQHSHQDSTAKGEEDERKRGILDQRWATLIENVDWDKDAVHRIITDLFSGWYTDETDRIRKLSLQGEKPQGLTKQEPTDYWQRFSRECIIEDEIRDKDVVGAIKEWQKNHEGKVYRSQSLADALYRIDGVAEKIEQFGALLFSSKEIRVLTSQLFAIVLGDKGVEAAGDNCSGFYNLWRLALEKKYQEHNDWLINEIQKSFKVSLLFAKDIYYFWRSQNKYSTSSEETTPELRKQMYDLFKNIFENRSELLLPILSQSDPWGLYHMVYLYRETNEDWNWLGNVLLSAGKDNPRLILSYIACLISNTERVHDMNGDYFENSINCDRVKEIFGENVRLVMEILQVEYEYPELADDFHHAQTRSVIENAREQARQWLKENQK